MDELQTLRSVLRRTKRPMKEVATLARVDLSWLRKLGKGKIPEPGYSKVRRLQRVLDIQLDVKETIDEARVSPAG